MSEGTLVGTGKCYTVKSSTGSPLTLFEDMSVRELVGGEAVYSLYKQHLNGWLLSDGSVLNMRETLRSIVGEVGESSPVCKPVVHDIAITVSALGDIERIEVGGNVIGFPYPMGGKMVVVPRYGDRLWLTMEEPQVDGRYHRADVEDMEGVLPKTLSEGTHTTTSMDESVRPLLIGLLHGAREMERLHPYHPEEARLTTLLEIILS